MRQGCPFLGLNEAFWLKSAATQKDRKRLVFPNRTKSNIESKTKANLFAAQSDLDLLTLALPECSNLFFGGIDSSMNLVEWVLLALLEFLSAELNTLVATQTRIFLFDFW